MPQPRTKYVIHDRVHPAVAKHESAHDVATQRYLAQLSSASKRFTSSLTFGRTAEELSMRDVVDDDIQQLPKSSLSTAGASKDRRDSSKVSDAVSKNEKAGSGSSTADVKIWGDKVEVEHRKKGFAKFSFGEIFGKEYTADVSSCRDEVSGMNLDIASASTSAVDKKLPSDPSVSTCARDEAPRVSRLKRLPAHAMRSSISNGEKGASSRQVGTEKDSARREQAVQHSSGVGRELGVGECTHFRFVSVLFC